MGGKALLWGVVVAGAMGAGAARAGQNQGGANRPPGPEPSVPEDRAKEGPPSADASVAARLHHINRMEVTAGQIAEQRAQAQAVRAYGSMLVRDHQAADERLMVWVSQDEAAKAALKRLADQREGTHEAAAEARMLEKLRKLPPDRFDREFLTDMVRGHDQAIEMVSRARDQVASFDLRALLQDTLPTLNEHRRVARRLLQEAEAPPVAREHRGPGTTAGAAAAAANPPPAGAPAPSAKGGAAPGGEPGGGGMPTPAVGASEIRQRIMSDSSLADDDIAVTINGTSVMLTGTVDSEAEKRHAGELAQKAAGDAMQVDNRLLLSGGRTVP
jgi:putative membrane protein